MAILQSRMIALINSALDYQQAFTTLCDSVKREADNVATGSTTPHQALLNLEAIASARILLQRPSESGPALAVEHYHFSRNARRNQRHAAKMQKLRRAQGTPGRGQQTSPFATDELYQRGPIRQPDQSHRGAFAAPTEQATANKASIDTNELDALVEAELTNYDDTTLLLYQQDNLDQAADDSLDPTTLASDETKPQ